MSPKKVFIRIVYTLNTFVSWLASCQAFQKNMQMYRNLNPNYNAFHKIRAH